MKKKITQLRWLATTLMLVAAMVMPSVAWAYNQPKGEGTKESPYQISSGDELYWFAAYVNGDPGEENGNYTACAVLTADIYVSEPWTTPIMCYSGTFDGNGHTISGLQKTISGGGGDIGLFGTTEEGSVICNVGIVNCSFSLIGGGGSVGGVCGTNNGTITNCYNTGTVDGTPGLVGGICGTNNGTITNCYNTGSVNKGLESGGVCGLNCENGTITNCYYLSGTAKGGIAGADDTPGSAEVKDATQFASGEVAWLLNGERSEGAEENPLAWYQNIGVDSYPVLDSSHKTVYCGYKDCTLSYSNNPEGLSKNPVHNYDNGICKACKAYQPATLTTDTYDINGDNTNDNVYEIGNAGQLYWFAGLVNGDASVCNYDATSNPSGTQQNTAACALLTANITVNSSLKENLNADGTVKDGYVVRSWTPIGGHYNKKDVYYNGIFDGNSKTIRGLYYGKSVSETYNLVGLFGQNKGIIKNVGIEDSYFKIDCNDNYVVCYVGGLCGFNQGTIENCDNASIVSVTETTQPTGAFVGGVCGDNVGGKIINCNNAGKVSSTVSLTYDNCVGGVSGANFQNSIIENSSNKGIVSGTNNVGGVCGLNCSNLEYKVTIKKCHNEGNVSGTNNVGGVCGNNGYYNLVNVSVIENCYNTGAVSGTSDVGGVSGINKGVEAGEPSIVTNCYNTGVVKGTSSVGGVVGGIYGSGVVNIINCYYLEGCSAKGTTFTRTEGTSKTADKFENGEVCYLLNGEKSKVTDENPLVWYQNIGNGAKDAYPILDSSHGTVYASTPCPINFSNTDNLAVEEHNYVANSEYTKHTCEKCGETHDAITVDNNTHSISACHGFGSVTLKAPTEDLTYDKTGKKATVVGALTGIATPNILYKLKNSSETATETVPVNAGTYIASITYTIGGVDYSVSVEYTIDQADNVPNRPNNLYGCIGAKLSTVSLKNYEGWSWDNLGLALTENAKNITVKASYNGADKDNYKNITAVDVTINLRSHKYTNGFCEYCGGIAPAQLVGTNHHQELINTHEGYYAIENAGQLCWFAGLVNGTLTDGTSQNTTAKGVLIGNIDLASISNWTPIGNESNRFGGTFDGKNFKVQHLSITQQGDNTGLFGFANGATMQNIWIDGNITLTTTKYTAGYGSIAGCMVNSTISNCHSSVNFTINTEMAASENCIGHIGGIVGKMDESNSTESYVSGCSYSGTINLGNKKVNVAAGIVGYAIYSDVPITNCSFTGTIMSKCEDALIMGGIFGYTRTSGNVMVTNCLQAGTLEKTGDSSLTGILIGQINTGYGANAVTNNYYTASTFNVIGRTTETPTTTPATLCTTDELKSGEICYLLNGSSPDGGWGQKLGTDSYPVPGSDKTVYRGYKCLELTYSNNQEELTENPVHRYNNGICETCHAYHPATLTTGKYDIDGDNTKDNVYEIGNAGQLYWFAGLVNGDPSVCDYDENTNPNGTQQNTYANAVITDNITFTSNFTAIGNSESYYSGTFNGKGHTVIVNQSESEDVALFGQIGACTIKNMKVTGTIKTPVKYAAGFAMHKQGTGTGIIENCISDVVIESTVSGDGTHGGIIGMVDNGTLNINNCAVTGAINGASTHSCGGIVGCTEGKSYINNTYVSATFTVSSDNSNIVSRNESNATATNCYYVNPLGGTKAGITQVDADDVTSGKLCMTINNGTSDGSKPFGQQLGTDNYPVPGSPYKLITTAYKKEDGTYWATFSDLTTDVTLSVPSTRTLKVYNATVSAGTMTLAKRDDNQVAKGEGVLLKTDGKYVNVKANEVPDWLYPWGYEENNLVATPETANPVGGNVDYTLYRLTYNTIRDEDNLGFYLGVAIVNGITYRDGFYVNATPGKAYLKALTSEAKIQSTAYLARGFAFPGDDGETTGIECITVTDESLHRNGNAEGIFDLQGRKVSKPTKGVYINNGKTVIIK